MNFVFRFQIEMGKSSHVTGEQILYNKIMNTCQSRTLFLASMPALWCMRLRNSHLFSDAQLYSSVVVRYEITNLSCTSKVTKVENLN